MTAAVYAAGQQSGAGGTRRKPAKAVTLIHKYRLEKPVKRTASVSGRSRSCSGRYLCQRSVAKIRRLGCVAPSLAPGNNVRAALALVERNEAPYGIVYGSDAVASEKVKVVGIPGKQPQTSGIPDGDGERS